jgi:hypothetical protein
LGFAVREEIHCVPRSFLSVEFFGGWGQTPSHLNIANSRIGKFSELCGIPAKRGFAFLAIGDDFEVGKYAQ